MPKKSSKTLRYFLSEAHFYDKDYSILIVTLIGPVVEINASIFLECLNQISKASSKWVVVNFRDVPSHLDPSFLYLFSYLRETVRRKGAELKLSGLHPHLKKMLQENELVHPAEIENNLAEAIESLPSTRIKI